MLVKELSWKNPVEIYQHVRNLPFAVFLDSSLNNQLGAYSIIAAQPFLVINASGRQTQIIEGTKTSFSDKNLFETLKENISRYQLSAASSKIPFNGGAIGYFGYELLHNLEKIPDFRSNDLKIPDSVFGFYGAGIIFDHRQKKVSIISTGLPEKNPAKTKRALEFFASLFYSNPENENQPKDNGAFNLKSNFAKSEYLKAVLKAKHYIKEGEIYQVNLSQRFSCPFRKDPWDLYRKLRQISPSPFSGYLNFGDFQLLCNSPERFLKVRGDLVETRPMKGTRCRGKTVALDQKLKKELVESQKDSAELLMITDLLRNDLGKVCEYGSVKVKQLKNLEKYSKVFQTTALIEGKLHKSKDRIDLIKACFPGGSITGAPKVRSMEIIAELEPTARGPYTGAMGYLDFCGNMDLNIIIRSILIKNSQAYFQVGGGIVADSGPRKEYSETLIKAKAIIEALRDGRK